MIIKPADGIMLRDPVTRVAIPAEGKDVDDNDLFWQRRVRDGDAIVITKTKKGAE